MELYGGHLGVVRRWWIGHLAWVTLLLAWYGKREGLRIRPWLGCVNPLLRACPVVGLHSLLALRIKCSCFQLRTWLRSEVTL